MSAQPKPSREALKRAYLIWLEWREEQDRLQAEQRSGRRHKATGTEGR